MSNLGKHGSGVQIFEVIFLFGGVEGCFLEFPKCVCVIVFVYVCVRFEGVPSGVCCTSMYKEGSTPPRSTSFTLIHSTPRSTHPGAYHTLSPPTTGLHPAPDSFPSVTAPPPPDPPQSCQSDPSLLDVPLSSPIHSRPPDPGPASPYPDTFPTTTPILFTLPPQIPDPPLISCPPSPAQPSRPTPDSSPNPGWLHP